MPSNTRAKEWLRRRDLLPEHRLDNCGFERSCHQSIAEDQKPCVNLQTCFKKRKNQYWVQRGNSGLEPRLVYCLRIDLSEGTTSTMADFRLAMTIPEYLTIGLQGWYKPAQAHRYQWFWKDDRTSCQFVTIWVIDNVTFLSRYVFIPIKCNVLCSPPNSWRAVLTEEQVGLR